MFILIFICLFFCFRLNEEIDASSGDDDSVDYTAVIVMVVVLLVLCVMIAAVVVRYLSPIYVLILPLVWPFPLRKGSMGPHGANTGIDPNILICFCCIRSRMGGGDDKFHANANGHGQFANPVYDQAPDNGAGTLTFMRGSVQNGNARPAAASGNMC